MQVDLPARHNTWSAFIMDQSPPPNGKSRMPLAPAKAEDQRFLKRALTWARTCVIGQPLSSEKMEHTLLSKFLALPVFASDAISSVAYATQEIILFLGMSTIGGVGLWEVKNKLEYQHYTMLLTGLIVALLAIVVFSYWQTIHGYPNGGGSYIVSKDNLGTYPGLIAAAALLIDYVLTVAVSIASGVQNLKNLPVVGPRFFEPQYLVVWCCLFTLVLMLANLRGLKESGSLFAVFTYGFVVMCYVMIAVGLIYPHLPGVHFQPHYQYVVQTWSVEPAARTFGLAVLLSAFANGCSAMTGTEAVSNGIPAFKEPKSHNAALTLIMMGVILGTVFLGVSALAMKFHVVYDGAPATPAVIDQISGAVFGKTGPTAIGYYLTQFFTAAILVLAANTSFADFPRLSSILARDRFMPKQLSNLGDKLVFNNGILILGALAMFLLIVKDGNVDALIPLYAIGVFTAFTLSQSGMVVHWFRLRGSGWRIRAAINGIGALATFTVLSDIIVEKFPDDLYVVVGIVIMVYVFKKTNHHYLDVANQLRMSNYTPSHEPATNTVLVLVPALHRGVMPALEYARTLSPDCRAVHVCTDPEKTPMLRERWEHWADDVPLVILNSPYRTLIEPLMAYLDSVRIERQGHTVTIVIPEYVPTKPWHALLHGQSAARLKLALLSRRDVVVANVRYYLQTSVEPPPSDSLTEEEPTIVAAAHGSHHGASHDH